MLLCAALLGLGLWAAPPGALAQEAPAPQEVPDGADAGVPAPGDDAPGEGEVPDGETPDGETPDGETPDGEVPDGEGPDGEAPDGEAPDGTEEVVPRPEPPERVAPQVRALRSGKVDEAAGALGIELERLGDEAAVKVLAGEATAGAGEIEAERKALAEELAGIERAAGVLAQQPTPTTATAAWLLEVRQEALARARARVEARLADNRARAFFNEESAAWLSARASFLAEDRARRALEDAAEARRRAEAEKAEEEAREASQQAQAELRRTEERKNRALDKLAGDENNQAARLTAERLSDALAISKEMVYLLDRYQEEVRLSSALVRERQELDASRARIFDEIKVLIARIDDRDRVEEAHQRADALYDELTTRREELRDIIERRERLLERVRDSHRDAHDAVSPINDAHREASEALRRSPDDELIQATEELARASRLRQERYTQMLDKKLERVAQSRDMVSAWRGWIKDAQMELIPLLSASRRDRLYEVTPENISGARTELSDLFDEARIEVRDTLEEARELPARALSLEGILWVFKMALVIAALVAAFRFLRRNRDRIVDGMRDRVLNNGLVSVRPALVIKIFEVFKAIFRELALLVEWNIGLSFISTEGPLILLARVTVGSVLAYRIVMGVLRTLVLPRWYRESLGADGQEAPPESLETQGGEGAEQGVDLFDMELQRAKFIVTTFRFLLLYTLVCQYSLLLIRRALGLFFVGHWLHILGYLGYGVVIYLLLSLWKDFIAAQFGRLAGEKTQRAVGFINTHKDRFYGMIVIFGAFLYVVGLELFRWAKRYIFNLEVTKRLLNFVFRKRIEMEKHEKAVEPTRPDALPPEVVEAFQDRPLGMEEALVVRGAQLAEILERLESWRQRRDDGAVALVGEYGMGKTTLVNVLEARLRGLGPLSRTEIRDKELEAEGALAIIASLFELDHVPSTPTQMAHVLLNQPRRVVLVDRCHNLYMRRVRGFGAIESFLQVVALTNHHHAWVLTFNVFSWRYINRLQDWGEAVHEVQLGPMGDDQIRALIESRMASTSWRASFRNLSVGPQNNADPGVDFVRSANGYFRLLADFSRGNPRVAMCYWLRSLRPDVEEGVMEVSLFKTPSIPLGRLKPHFGFALAAIVQHESLTAAELRSIINVDAGVCSLTLDRFIEMGVIKVDPRTGRARMMPEFFRQVLQHLRTVNFLYD